METIEKVILAIAISITIVGIAATMNTCVAMPEDLEDWDTPSERAWVYGCQLQDLKENMLRMGISEYLVKQRMEVYYYRYQEKLEKYTRMYKYINVTVLTTDSDCDGSVEVDNVEFTYGNCTYSLGPGVFSWNCSEGITVELEYFTVTAKVVAFDEDAQTATLVDISVKHANGYVQNYSGPYEVAW